MDDTRAASAMSNRSPEKGMKQRQQQQQQRTDTMESLSKDIAANQKPAGRSRARSIWGRKKDKA